MHSSDDIGAACGGGSGVSIAGAARGAAFGEGAPPALFPTKNDVPMSTSTFSFLMFLWGFTLNFFFAHLDFSHDLKFQQKDLA
jgi:hypothetical protein